MRVICNRIVEYLFKRGLVDNNDKNALRFGLELIITQMLTLITILIIGFIIGWSYQTLVYCIFFVGARRTFEGYHAKTFGMCYFLTLLFYVGILILTALDLKYIYLNFFIMIFLMIYLKNHQKNKAKIIRYILFYLGSIIVFKVFGFDQLLNMCSLILFLVLLVSELGWDKNEFSDC